MLPPKIGDGVSGFRVGSTQGGGAAFLAAAGGAGGAATLLSAAASAARTTTEKRTAGRAEDTRGAVLEVDTGATVRVDSIIVDLVSCVRACA